MTEYQRTVIDNPFIPIVPTRRQALFLTYPMREALYGGAAGGGKSAALLAGALQYVTRPGYAALLLRRTFADLKLPGALIDRASEWLSGTPARWNAIEHQWTFPGGSTLTFGYLENENDKYRYQSSEFQYIGFDELTQFSESQYRYMLSRLRRLVTASVPLRVRAASNPGGTGHEWVKRRFIDGLSRARGFISAKLEDNPHLDREEYEHSLDELDPVTRAQLRHGNWTIRPEGNLFKREWFADRIADRPPPDCRWVRYWDLAASKKQDANDPDYASGCRLGVAPDGRVFVTDMRHFRDRPHAVEERFRTTAAADGVEVPIRIEQEPGSASVLYIDSLARSMSAFDVRGIPAAQDKVTRARPASAACERKDVWLVAGAWVDPFLDELCAFPAVAHDDQVDAFTGAFNTLANDAEPWGSDEFAGVMSYDD